MSEALAPGTALGSSRVERMLGCGGMGAVTNHEPNMPYITTGPQYAPIRANPRLRAIVKQMNLPE